MSAAADLTPEEIDLLASFPLLIKNDDQVSREATIRYIELADRFVMNAVERGERLREKNREYAEAYTELVKKVRALSDQNNIQDSKMHGSKW